MNSAEYVDKLVSDLKAKGTDPQTIAWKAALACVGWAYVFGAAGQECTPSYRRSAYSSHGADNPTIKSACKNFNGTGSCSGCKWFPGGKRTRVFDCRGFTRWILKQAYGWTLQGGGCTSQWNTASNWSKKGKISDGIPKDTLVCLFYSKNNKEVTWQHTGFGLNGETVECSAGVQHFTSMNKKWTHWAVPVCVSGDVPTPTPTPTPTPEKGYAVVTGKNLALREGPSTDCKVITRIATGSTLKITKVPDDWEYVTFGGKSGFVMKKYIKEG